MVQMPIAVGLWRPHSVATLTPFFNASSVLPDTGTAIFTGNELQINQIPDPSNIVMAALVVSAGALNNDTYKYTVDFETTTGETTNIPGDSNNREVSNNAVAGQI